MGNQQETKYKTGINNIKLFFIKQDPSFRMDPYYRWDPQRLHAKHLYAKPKDDDIVRTYMKVYEVNENNPTTI